ncbi:MAG: hypothetical protein L3K14_08340 [Thermoplasmata archaeon]|nr:hypothetical protein [Thermoplasmata archaeon]
MVARRASSVTEHEEELAERDRLDHLDAKIRELQPKRRALIDKFLRLSDEQQDMFNERAPQQGRLEALNEEHRLIGRDLAHVRGQLDAARRLRDDRLIAVRELRAAMPKTARSRVDLIRKEVEQLELEQQTRAVPLEEENALIGRMRSLRKEVSLAEAEGAAVAKQREALRVAEDAFEAGRVEVERLRRVLDEMRAARDHAMESLKGELVVVGQHMARLREKSQERGIVRRDLEEIDRTLRGMEREFDDLRHRYRARRGEARRVVIEHNRSARRAVSDPSAMDRAVDDRLEQLLKEGKIRLA